MARCCHGSLNKLSQQLPKPLSTHMGGGKQDLQASQHVAHMAPAHCPHSHDACLPCMPTVLQVLAWVVALCWCRCTWLLA